MTRSPYFRHVWSTVEDRPTVGGPYKVGQADSRSKNAISIQELKHPKPQSDVVKLLSI